MKRIDVTDVPALFKRVGIEPIQGPGEVCQGEKLKCGCILQAMMVDAGRTSGLQIPMHEFGEPMFGTDYSFGLVCGWDGKEKNLTVQHTPEWLAGFEDGHAAWAAVVIAEMGG